MSKSKKNKIPIEFSIKKIELTENHFDIPDNLDAFNIDDAKYDLSISLEFDNSNSIIDLKIKYLFFDNNKNYIELTVLNSFEITNLKQLFFNNKFIQPDFLFFLAETSINHTRGLQALLIKDTIFKNYYIPPIIKSQIVSKIKL